MLRQGGDVGNGGARCVQLGLGELVQRVGSVVPAIDMVLTAPGVPAVVQVLVTNLVGRIVPVFDPRFLGIRITYALALI